MIPTEPPAAPGIDAVSRATYSINIVNGRSQNIPSSEYFADLIGAMDILAVEVAERVDDILGRRTLRNRLRRKLAVLVDLPTSIDEINDAVGFMTEPTLVDGLFTLGGKTTMT
jgi:hypothetical protein